MNTKPTPRIEKLPVKSGDGKTMQDWTLDDAINLMGYVTYFPDGQIQLSLVDKEPTPTEIRDEQAPDDGLFKGGTALHHEARAYFLFDAQGQVTDVGLMHLRDGQMLDIGQEPQPDPDLHPKWHGIFSKKAEEANFKRHAQRLLDVMNHLSSNDLVVEPLGPDFTMNGKIDPVILKNTAHEFVEDVVLSQMGTEQLMGLNSGQMTADMIVKPETPRLETSERLRANRNPKI